MSDAPKRIWAWAWEVDRHRGQWTEDREIVGEGIAYARADALEAALARIAELEAANAKLEAVRWMAEEWFRHGGSECTDANEYRADLVAAGADL